MFGAPPKELPQKLAFLLVPDFSMIAFTSAVEPLRLANRASGRELYSWHLFSPDGKPVTASNGIAVTPEGRVEDAGGFGTVVLCSGIDGHLYEDRNVFAQLRKFDRKGADVGALCTGSHILARAGLLDGYRCTIHWENLRLRREFPAYRGDLGAVRDRPQPLHLLGRHRLARHDAEHHRAPARPRAGGQRLRPVHA
jgi:transcriptional regulator GlxA family with amidase domain